MQEEGVTHYKTPRGNIRFDRKIWASSDGNVQGMISALRKDGLDELVSDTVNGNTLAGFVREFDPGKRLSPKQIAKAIKEAGFINAAKAVNITEKLQLVVSGKK